MFTSEQIENFSCNGLLLHYRFFDCLGMRRDVIRPNTYFNRLGLRPVLCKVKGGNGEAFGLTPKDMCKLMNFIISLHLQEPYGQRAKDALGYVKSLMKNDEETTKRKMDDDDESSYFGASRKPAKKQKTSPSPELTDKEKIVRILTDVQELPASHTANPGRLPKVSNTIAAVTKELVDKATTRARWFMVPEFLCEDKLLYTLFTMAILLQPIIVPATRSTSCSIHVRKMLKTKKRQSVLGFFNSVDLACMVNNGDLNDREHNLTPEQCAFVITLARLDAACHYSLYKLVRSLMDRYSFRIHEFPGHLNQSRLDDIADAIRKAFIMAKRKKTIVFSNEEYRYLDSWLAGKVESEDSDYTPTENDEEEEVQPAKKVAPQKVHASVQKITTILNGAAKNHTKQTKMAENMRVLIESVCDIRVMQGLHDMLVKLM